MSIAYVMTSEADRVTAVDADGVAIAGAYRPAGHDYWALFITRLVTDLTGLTVPPHREHFYGANGKSVATAWVELIAALYTLGLSAVTA